MIRNISLFIAGAVVGIVVLVWIGKSFHPQFLAEFFMTPLNPSSGSPVRVVGGSINIHLCSGLGFSNVTANGMDVSQADISAFGLVGVSQSQGSTSGISPQFIGQSAGWEIDEYVGSSAGKVVITTNNGVLHFQAPTQGDIFSVSDDMLAAQYKNGDVGCTGTQCELPGYFVVKIPGKQDATWYCVDSKKHCHINIGN